MNAYLFGIIAVAVLTTLVAVIFIIRNQHRPLWLFEGLVEEMDVRPAKSNNNRLQVIKDMLRQHGKKITAYALIGVIAIGNAILFGSYVWDFILNNAGWVFGLSGVLLGLVLIVLNWTKMPIWESLATQIKKLGYKAIGNMITGAAIVLLITAKNYQYASLMLLVIAPIFYRLNDVYQKRIKKNPAEGIKLGQDIKTAFAFKLWLVGFIAVSGSWMIYYVF